MSDFCTDTAMSAQAENEMPESRRIRERQQVEDADNALMEELMGSTSGGSSVMKNSKQTQTDEEEGEEEPDDEEFKCPSCRLVQSNNCCYLCDTDNTCQNCVGHGGDYGEHEEWICQTRFDNQPEEEEEAEEIGEEQFRCPSCKLVQSMSTCYLCDIENTCETCVGDGGSYGEDEEWICQPCVDKQPKEEDECVEEYPFYIYHDASFGDDRDNCPACYGSYGDISEEAIETIHDEYDDTDDIPCYSRQRLNAYLKPSTYKRLTAKTLDTNTVLFALANMGLWGECDEELGLDKLDDDEIVEDASDDLYVCYANGGKEYDAHSYFREHKIHLCFGGSGCTEFAEWHDGKVHPQN